MFDVWLSGVEVITVFLIFSFVVLLPVQLLLCFKVKSKVIRLLPVILLCIPTLFFLAKAMTSTGWDNLGYIFPVIFTGFMLFICGIAWGTWAIIQLVKTKKGN